MYKWLILAALIGMPLVFLYMYDFQGNGVISGQDEDKSSVLDIGQDFIKQVSHDEPSKENTLGMFEDISDANILKEKEIPDLNASEKIQNSGVRLSTNYNQLSYDYSNGKIPPSQYLAALMDFKIKYEKYMTALDSYIGSEDITIQRNSMIQELRDIEQQINTLKNSKTFEDGWESKSEYDKYKKLLPSMFTP